VNPTVAETAAEDEGIIGFMKHNFKQAGIPENMLRTVFSRRKVILGMKQLDLNFLMDRYPRLFDVEGMVKHFCYHLLVI